MVNFCVGDKVTKAAPLEELINLNMSRKSAKDKNKDSDSSKNKEKGCVHRKELFYSPNEEMHMIRLVPTKVDGVKALVINPSFKIMNLLPIDIQYNLKSEKYTTQAMLTKNTSIDIYQLDVEQGKGANLH